MPVGEGGTFLKVVLTGGPCGGKTTALSHLTGTWIGLSCFRAYL